MGKADWIIHNVLDETLSYHTHGLEEVCGYELEIVLPIRQEKASEFLHYIAERIMNGYKIEDGLRADGLFSVPIYFFKTSSFSDDLRTVWRIVFPDENGYYPWTLHNGQRCSKAYIDQIEFNKIKVFFLEIEDNEKAQEVIKEQDEDKFSFGTGLYNFRKKGDYYISPIQYFIPQDDNNLILTCPLFNNSKTETEMLGVLKAFNDFNFKVVCRDFDKADISNESFIQWALGFDKTDPIRKVIEEV